MYEDDDMYDGQLLQQHYEGGSPVYGSIGYANGADDGYANGAEGGDGWGGVVLTYSDDDRRERSEGSAVQK